MKISSIVVSSILISAVTMTSAHAMGMAEGGIFDENNDGKITKDEFIKMNAKMAAKEFAMMDLNDDGNVTAEEYTFAMTNR